MFTAQIVAPKMRSDVIFIESRRAADDIAASVRNYVKLALTRSGKIATGKTLKSIAVESVLDSPSRGLFRRHVVGAKSWLFIQQGRRKGAKMPVVRVAGVTKRGGKVFLPVPEMLDWFRALNIPPRLWFPILRAIKRRGIKPTNIRDKAVKESRVRINEVAAQTADRISKGLFKK